MSVVRRRGEKIGNTYWCRRLKVFVKAITKTDPQCNEESCESNYAKSEVARSSSYIPPSHYECMDSENLVICTLVF